MKYLVIADRRIDNELHAKIGDVVYLLRAHDYGLARDDTEATGEEHVSVTKNSDGSYPSFTIPVSSLRKFVTN